MTKNISYLTELGKFLRTTKWADIVGINIPDPYTNERQPLVAIKLGQKPKIGFLISEDEKYIPVGATHLFYVSNKIRNNKWGNLELLSKPDVHPISTTHYIDLWYRWRYLPKKLGKIDKRFLSDWITAIAQASSDTIIRSHPILDDLEIILNDLKFGNTAKWTTFRRRLKERIAAEKISRRIQKK